MKRVVGFALFCMALGIILSFCIKTRFVEVVVVVGLMVIGFNMFISPGKGKNK